MLRNAGLIFCLGALLIVVQFCGGQSSDSEENPTTSFAGVENGGFEILSPESGDPRGWHATRFPETANDVEFAIDNQEKHSGEQSISIYIKDSHPKEHPKGGHSYSWYREVEYEIGKTYELTAWVKTENLNECAFIFSQCYDTSKKSKTYIRTSPFEPALVGSNDWTQVKSIYTVPEKTSKVRILVGLGIPSNIGGKVWFDDIQVKLLPY